MWLFYWIPKVQKCFNLVDIVKSFQPSIYYLLAKIGFDTAENEPLKVWIRFHSPWEARGAACVRGLAARISSPSCARRARRARGCGSSHSRSPSRGLRANCAPRELLVRLRVVRVIRSVNGEQMSKFSHICVR